MAIPKEPATRSAAAARACLLRRHTENEVASLLLASELRRATSLVRDVIDSVDWLRETRSRLRAIDDLPRGVEFVVELDPLGPEEVEEVKDIPKGAEMIAAMNSARELAICVKRARELLPKTALFVHPDSTPPDSLRDFARLAPEDFVAVLLVVSEKAGFGPKFTATEAMAFSVLSEVESPTEDSAQRLNTWSKRLLRNAKRADAPLVGLGRVFLQIMARRAPTLAAAEAIYVKGRNAS